MFVVHRNTLAVRWNACFLLAVGLTVANGCQTSPKLEQASRRIESLQSQHEALLTELENVKAKHREKGDQLRTVETQLAELSEQDRLNRQQLRNLGRERQQFASFVRGAEAVPSDLSGRLADLAAEYPALHYDAVTGIAKLDTNVLFASGSATLKSQYQGMLTQFASLMDDPRNRDFKILIGGHTDDLDIKGREVHREFPTNWHLSTARSLAVVEFLKHRGIDPQRLGVTGFAKFQPIAPNNSARNRQLNRRAEILVVSPDTRVPGWSETTPSLY